MSFDLKDIKILESESFIFTLFNFLFLVLPGIAIVYIFNHELFMTADWIKIILLSGSITAPLVLVNTFIVSIYLHSKNNNSENILFISFFLSITLSALLLYTIIAPYYFLDRTFKEGLYFILIIEGILILLTMFRISKLRQR